MLTNDKDCTRWRRLRTNRGNRPGLAPTPLLVEAPDEWRAASPGMLPAARRLRGGTQQSGQQVLRAHTCGPRSSQLLPQRLGQLGGDTKSRPGAAQSEPRGQSGAAPPAARPERGPEGPGRGAFINPFPTGRLRKRPPRPCAASRARAGKGWRRVGATRGGGAAGAAPSSPSPARRRRQEEEEGAERRHGGQHVPSGR